MRLETGRREQCGNCLYFWLVAGSFWCWEPIHRGDRVLRLFSRNVDVCLPWDMLNNVIVNTRSRTLWKEPAGQGAGSCRAACNLLRVESLGRCRKQPRLLKST